MNKLVSDAALLAAKAETTAILGEHWEHVAAAMAEAYAAHCHAIDRGTIGEGAKFQFAVTLKAVLKPRAGDVRVSATIAIPGVTLRDESAGVTVGAQGDLFVRDDA